MVNKYIYKYIYVPAVNIFANALIASCQVRGAYIRPCVRTYRSVLRTQAGGVAAGQRSGSAAGGVSPRLDQKWQMYSKIDIRENKIT